MCKNNTVFNQAVEKLHPDEYKPLILYMNY